MSAVSVRYANFNIAAGTVRISDLAQAPMRWNRIGLYAAPASTAAAAFP